MSKVKKRQFAFKTISTPAGTSPVALNNADTLTLSSDSAITVTGNSVARSVALALSVTGVAAATYGAAASVGQFTVDAQGRITAASNVAIAISAGAVSGLSTVATSGSHLDLSNIGTNTHAQIDTHIADSTVHFTEGSIDHTAITNIGTNSHAAIDTHIADTALHAEYLSGPGVAVVWPDGSGTHATVAAAYADATIDTVYLMPTEVGGAAHIIDNSAGPLVISRDFYISGIGAESNISLHGNTLGNNLFSITGSAEVTFARIAFATGKVIISNTGTGRLIVRNCEATGTIGYETFVSMNNASGGLIMQDNVATFSSGVTIIVTAVNTCAIIGNSIVLPSTGALSVAAGTNVSIESNNFFTGSPQLAITGGAKVVSRSNTYDTPGALGGININGASGNFQSQGDVAIGGANHVTVDAANAMTYHFRNGSFDFSKVTRPSGQVRLQQLVDENASLYCSTLKAFTDSSNTAITTIADGSTSLGTSISGVGSKTLNLSPSSGSAISLGTITAGSGQTAALNVTGAGGLNSSSIILSGASAISGAISHTGEYNKNFGDIINTGAASGTITLAGNSCLNLGTILDGGTITFGSTTRGMLYSGLAQNSGVVTLAGTGAAIGGANGSGTSFIVGASGKFSAAIGSVTSTSATTNSIECTGQGSLTVATIEMPTFSPAVTTGTNFFKNNSGSGNFLGGYTSFVDLLGGAGGDTTIDHRATSSGVGTFTWVAMNGQVAPGFGSSSSTITVTNSGNGSAIIGQCYNGGIGSGVSSMVASQNGSIVMGRAVDGTLSGTGAACFIAAATSSGITVSASSTGSSAIGSAAGYAITSSGLGSRARGYANTAAIVASATNSNQQGPGTNAQADSSQFGIAGSGIRLLHTTSAPTTEYNGTIRQNASGYMILRSGGVNITLQPSAAYTPTNVTTDRSYDANATTLDELADIVGTLIADLKVTGLIS